MTEKDIFDDVVLLEERFQNEGYRAGFDVGRKAGIHEGWNLGWEKGASFGTEIGFYLGFAEILLQKLKEDNRKPRVCKTLQSILSLIEDLPVCDPANQKLFEKMEKIRDKMKQMKMIDESEASLLLVTRTIHKIPNPLNCHTMNPLQRTSPDSSPFKKIKRVHQILLRLY